MPSAVLFSIRSYPAYPIGIRTGTPVVCSSKSSRIMEKSFQYSFANIRYRPNCLYEIHRLYLHLFIGKKKSCRIIIIFAWRPGTTWTLSPNSMIILSFRSFAFGEANHHKNDKVITGSNLRVDFPRYELS